LDGNESLQKIGLIFLSAITLGELEAGIERARRRDVAKAAVIEAWDQLAASLQVLPMDLCFREWGRLMGRESDHLSEHGALC
jgi:hypothetical protein